MNKQDAAIGEYDSYAPHILRMVLRGATAGELDRHLSQLERDAMGLSKSRPASARAHSVERLVSLRQEPIR